MLIPGTTETVTLRKRTGETHHFDAMVQPTKIFTEDSDLPVEEGDVVERALPNGMVETYVVEDRGFRKGLDDIPDHYQMKVRKGRPTKLEPQQPTTRTHDLAKGTQQPTTHRGLIVFISHSSKDADLALTLIDLLKAALDLRADQIRCSSVDGYRLPVGVNTESKLREEVNAAKVVVGLITPNSLSSAYVMFELGARWGASGFLAPLLAGVKTVELSGPLSLLNALSASSDAQLHQLIGDIAKYLGLERQPAESYIRNVTAVKMLADTIAKPMTANPVLAAPVKQKLRVTVSAEGNPPSQVLRVVANRPVEVSRVDYMLSSEATVAGEDMSVQGEKVDIPINDGAVIKLWNTPRADRNHYDHSGPAKIAIAVSADGDTIQYVLPVQMESMIQNNTAYRRIVGSKTFYGST